MPDFPCFNGLKTGESAVLRLMMKNKNILE